MLESKKDLQKERGNPALTVNKKGQLSLRQTGRDSIIGLVEAPPVLEPAKLIKI
jgi:hypothetical protein